VWLLVLFFIQYAGLSKSDIEAGTCTARDGAKTR
jgi:hypothetical protein